MNPEDIMVSEINQAQKEASTKVKYVEAEENSGYKGQAGSERVEGLREREGK